jgi:hypothetical protein
MTGVARRTQWHSVNVYLLKDNKYEMLHSRFAARSPRIDSTVALNPKAVTAPVASLPNISSPMLCSLFLNVRAAAKIS